MLGPARLSILDVENLRLHYARTLAHWSRRFAIMSDQVRARYGEEFRRAWELYLVGSEAAFATGSLQLFQVVFAPMEALLPTGHAQRYTDEQDRMPARLNTSGTTDIH